MTKIKELKEENARLWYYLYIILTHIVKMHNDKSNNVEELYTISDNVLSHLNFGEKFGLPMSFEDFRNKRNIYDTRI